jgi:nitrate/nitrite transport system substrate-binding protein
MSVFTRRSFLIRTALVGTAFCLPVGLAGAALAAPGKPETTSVELGFIALTDSAPLIIAKEKGYFAKEGMTGVELKKQTSWALAIKAGNAAASLRASFGLAM